MRSIVATCALACCLGCGALDFPFSADGSGEILLPLGGVSRGCEGSGFEELEDGESVRYTHTRMTATCILDATWSGTLFDMEEVRAQAEERIRAEGFDPEDVQMRITAIDLDVTDVGLRDARTDEDIELAGHGLVTYRAAIFVGGDELVVVEQGTDVQVKQSDALVELGNEAYQNRAQVPATGVARVVVDLTEVPTVAGAVRPALSLQYEIVVAGTVTPTL